MKNIQCSECAFCEQQDAQLTCVRFPPVPHVIPSRNLAGEVVPQVVSMRPVVVPTWYCGEFTMHDESDKTSTKQAGNKGKPRLIQ